MVLSDLRTKLKSLSGRYELSDDECDFFLNGGHRFLDLKYRNPNIKTNLWLQVTAGEYGTSFQQCLVLSECWVENTDGITQLKEYRLDELQQEYASPVDDIDGGRPLFYAPVTTRGLDPDSARGTQGDFLDLMESEVNVSGIIWMPPADGTYVLKLVGKFGETLGSTDTWWSGNYPDVLLMAGLYKMEVFNRNSEGMKDWLTAIDVSMSELDKNMVMEEIANVDQMRG